MKRPNAWYQAILSQLRTEGGPLTLKQIWERMQASGFAHGSRVPRGTLGARVFELAQMRRLERVGPGRYRLVESLEILP